MRSLASGKVEVTKSAEIARVADCPICDRSSKRHSKGSKVIKTLGGVTHLEYSKHYCDSCRKHFTNPEVCAYGPLNGGSSWQFILKALSFTETMTLEASCFEVRKDTGNYLSPTTLHEWIVKGDELFSEMPDKGCLKKEN